MSNVKTHLFLSPKETYCLQPADWTKIDLTWVESETNCKKCLKNILRFEKQIDKEQADWLRDNPSLSEPKSYIQLLEENKQLKSKLYEK